MSHPDRNRSWQRVDARLAGVGVWVIWVLCVVVAAHVIWKQGVLLPYSDDWNMVPAIAGVQPITWEWLWAQHNEHRIVLPKLIFVAAARLGAGDFRWAICVNLAILASSAALLILTARRIRGHSSLLDVFYPLLLLHLGQGGLIWGFEFQFVSATVLVCVILCLMLWHGSAMSAPAAGAAGVCLLLLPFCGGNGLLYVPILGLWLGLRGFWLWRGRSLTTCGGTETSTQMKPNHFAGLCLIGCAGAAAVMLILYFVGYSATPNPWPKAGSGLSLVTASHVLAGALGARVDRFWPLSGIAVATLILGCMVWVAFCVVRRTGDGVQQSRMCDLAVFLTAVLMLVIAVGYGRGGRGWESDLNAHYATLALPGLFAAYLLLTLAGWKWVPVVVQVGLLVTTAAFAWTYIRDTTFSNTVRSAGMDVVKREITAGIPERQIAERHVGTLFFEDTPESRQLIESGISYLRHSGFSNFGPGEHPKKEARD